MFGLTSLAYSRDRGFASRPVFPMLERAAGLKAPHARRLTCFFDRLGGKFCLQQVLSIVLYNRYCYGRASASKCFAIKDMRAWLIFLTAVRGGFLIENPPGKE